MAAILCQAFKHKGYFMEMATYFQPWLIWFMLGIAVSLSELVIPGFVIIFFGIGCLGAAAFAIALPDSYAGQLATFIMVTILSLLVLRKVAMRIFVGKSELAQAETGGQNFIKARIVIAQDLAEGQETRVSYRGSTWRARAEEQIIANTEAEIAGFDQADKSCLILKVFKQP